MKTTLIDGNAISRDILGSVAATVRTLDRKPGLAVVLVGSHPESALYVKLKQNAAHKVGIQTHIYTFPENASDDAIISAIRFLNRDDDVDGIIVQLPLPAGHDTDAILGALDPDKDADGFLERNRTLLLNDRPYVTPVLVRVIERILNDTGLNLEGKSAAIISDSAVFCEPIAHILRTRGASVSIVEPAQAQSRESLGGADLVITATGLPFSVSKDAIKPGAALIDIGISKYESTVRGDIDPQVDSVALWRTPVPGGVGPITVAMLLDNVLKLYEKSAR